MEPIFLRFFCLLFCLAVSSAAAEFRYWNLDGEERVVPQDLSVSDLLSSLDALKQGLKKGVRHRQKTGAEWGEGDALFQEFFGETKSAIERSIAGARLSRADSELTLLQMRRDLNAVEGSLDQLNREFSSLDQYARILPSGSRSRPVVQKEMADLQGKIQRAEEKLEGLYDLEETLNRFAEDVKRYHEKLAERLARSLGTNPEWEVSAEAEQALGKWFKKDPALAQTFQKTMVLGEGTTLFAASETALKLFLLAGDATGSVRRSLERIRAVPDAGWTEASRPLLEKLAKEYGVKNTAEVRLASAPNPNCDPGFDQLFRSKRSPELN
jgi:hypothetical protein